MTDHEEGATGRVDYFRRPEPEYAGDRVHEACGRTWHDHGWIDSGAEGEALCPGGTWQVGDLMQYREGRWRPLVPAGDPPSRPAQQQGPLLADSEGCCGAGACEGAQQGPAGDTAQGEGGAGRG